MSKLSISSPKFLLLGAVLLASWLRIRGLFSGGLQADEALFASWARLIAVWRDPLLTTQLVDKPPLAFYAQALFYPLFGEVIWAARLPNFIASLLLVGLTAVLTHQLTRSRNAALFAALLVACSPLAIQFSTTAYTDPLLVTLLIAALCVALGKRPFAAGLLFALALATKYQAILFLPLLFLFLFVQKSPQSTRSAQRKEKYFPFPSPRSPRSPWLNFSLGLAVPLTAVFLWELSRTGSFLLWNRQIDNFGGLRLAWSWELWPRLLAWGGIGRFLLAGGWLLLLLILLAGLTAGLISQAATVGNWQLTIDHWQFSVLSLFTLAYAALHLFAAIPPWPRYALPLVPLVATLAASAIISLINRLKNHRGARGDFSFFSPRPPRSPRLNSTTALLTLFLIVQLTIGWQASNGRFLIGSQTQAASVVTPDLAATLLDQPYGTVLYDHFYSWQWRYYYFDKTVFVNWVPHPAALAEDLTAFGRDGSPRFIALPQSPAALPLIRAVEEAEFTLTPRHTDNNITLYEIQPVVSTIIGVPYSIFRIPYSVFREPLSVFGIRYPYTDYGLPITDYGS